MLDSGQAEGVTATATTSPLDAGWAADALRSVWARQLTRIDGRIATLEQALAALAEGRLDAESRLDAVRAAHMLAGTLGIFGLAGASRAAGALERELERSAPACMPTAPAVVRFAPVGRAQASGMAGTPTAAEQSAALRPLLESVRAEVERRRVRTRGPNRAR